ncbi:aldo/keto reductase [Hydrogenophaga sp.]|uniref:aldo/keto reductase n=1 Tax=Hydrogenophaga sp. TaxID=1904254 RepID=UPI00271C99B4|nr:aldo/keto reductase [Hydrogenophaga sp.]MDO9438419.1 aldo/keto reductase [Hydrogenophaga sp.]
MKSIAVIQARTNSTRLPAKVLLPVGGMPLVVLAAKRAGNTGREVIVATSDEPTDDMLSHTLAQHAIACFRGPLDDTLARMTQSLAQWDDDTIVFRLTADNVFPDGALLDAMEREFVSRNLAYLACNGTPSGLPYGVSAEVTRLRHLREASAQTTEAYDREHVTPYIRARFGAAHFEQYKSLAMGQYRCTVDCLDDYLLVGALFQSIDRPAMAPLLSLLERLKDVPPSPRTGAPASRMVMGGAQLGLAYGAVNTTGQPTQASGAAMIKAAIANGVTMLDTARAYGTSEEVIGESLKDGWQGRAEIVTKLSPLSQCPDDAGEAFVHALVDASIFQSLSSLKTTSLDVLLLHRAEHLSQWHGAAWHRLQAHQEAGRVRRLGVSVQNPLELARVLQEPSVSHIQLPCNLVDWRWDEAGAAISTAKRERRLTIHARSPYLQGVLLSQEAGAWAKAHVNPAQAVTEWLQQMVAHCQRNSVADLCLAYLNAIEWIDGVVVGAERMEQLEQNIDLFGRPPLAPDDMALIRRTRPRLDASTLDPALWLKDRT